MGNFGTWLEVYEKGQYVYHVTYLKNLNSIFKSILVPRGGISPWIKPHLRQHAKNGVFFCQTLKCAQGWVEATLDQSFHLSDNPIHDQLIPVIIRFKIRRNAWRSDDLGGAEIEHSYYSTKNIDPRGIQLWDGDKWTNDINSANKIKEYMHIDDGDYFDTSSYPFPPQTVSYYY